MAEPIRQDFYVRLALNCRRSLPNVITPRSSTRVTVRDIANHDGALIEHYRYDAFGRILEGDTSRTRYLYTAREFDASTGLQYNRNRWYDSGTGRWLSEDPSGFAGGDTNLYRYVGNGPTNGTDPSGLAGIIFVPPPGHGPTTGWMPDWLADLFEPDASDFVSTITPAGVVAGIGKKAINAVGKHLIGEAGEKAIGKAGKNLVGKHADDVVRVTGEALVKVRREFAAIKPLAWMEEATKNAKNYSVAQLKRMKKGQAPIGSDGFSIEIHHKKPLAEGGQNVRTNFRFLSRSEHRLGPNYKVNHPNLP